MNKIHTIFSKKTLRGFLFAGLLLFGLTAGITAEGTLTLEQARVLAEENSATLRSAYLEMDLQDLEKAALKYDWYPAISLSAGAGTSGTEEQYLSGDISASAGLSLKQQLWDGGIYSLEKDLAEIKAGIAAGEWESTLLKIRNQCDLFFFSYLEAQAQEDSARADAEAANALLKETEGKLEAGIITRLSYLEAKADAASKETTLLTMERNTLAARTELASYLCLEELPEIEYSIGEHTPFIEAIAGMTEEKSQEITRQLISLGMAEAPGLLSASLAVDEAELSAAISKKEYAPTISLSFSDELSAAGWDNVSNNGSLSLSASLTLSQWKRSNTADQAAITLEQASLSSDETCREYTLSIENAWYDLLSSSRTVVSAEAAQEYAEELYKETLEMYRLSAKSLSDLTDAKATLITNRNTCTSARFDFQKNLSTLVYILGLQDEAPLRETFGL